MTERERVRDEKKGERRTTGADAVGVYNTPEPRVTAGATRDYDGDLTTARAVDRVRWGSVLAGIFAAISTLMALTVLGLAIGLSSFDAGDTAGPFGFGAGIWGAISTLIAFFVGGLIAARTAAVGGHSNGILNGAMVWFVAIPLLLYALGSGIGGWPALLAVSPAPQSMRVQRLLAMRRLILPYRQLLRLGQKVQLVQSKLQRPRLLAASMLLT